MGKHRLPGMRRLGRIGTKERLRCQVCNRALLHMYGAGRRRETCSAKCRQQLFRDRQRVKKFLKKFSARNEKKSLFLRHREIASAFLVLLLDLLQRPIMSVMFISGGGWGLAGAISGCLVGSASLPCVVGMLRSIP